MLSSKLTRNHLKDKKITILQLVEDDNSTSPAPTYAPVPGLENIWAYYRHVSGKEYWAAASEQHELDVVFEVNYHAGIIPNMVIQFRDHRYVITQIDDFEGNKATLRLYCSTSA